MVIVGCGGWSVVMGVCLCNDEFLHFEIYYRKEESVKLGPCRKVTRHELNAACSLASVVLFV